MSRNAVRAKIRHKNKDIHLGYYQTQAQATAAKAGAHAALDKWEELNPPKPPPKRKLPSVETLKHFISQGVYDPVIEQLKEIIVARSNLVKRMEQASKAATWFGKGVDRTIAEEDFNDIHDRYGKGGYLIG